MPSSMRARLARVRVCVRMSHTTFSPPIIGRWQEGVPLNSFVVSVNGWSAENASVEQTVQHIMAISGERRVTFEPREAREAQEAQRQKKQRLKLFRNQPLGDKSKIIHVLLEDECGPILIQERVINLRLPKLPKRNGDRKQSGVHAHLLCRSKMNTYTQCEMRAR